MGNQSAVEMKKCGRCKEWLPMEQFGRKNTNKDGLQNECRDCRAVSVNIWRSLRFEHPVAGTEGLTLADTIAETPVKRDVTFPKVVQALHHWVRKETLTWAQGEAILLHVVDGLSFSDIARMYNLNHTTVMYHYNNGIRNLRNRYGIEVRSHVS